MDEAAFIEECADWIAAQLEEENIWVDGGLLDRILTIEREFQPFASRHETAEALHRALTEAGIQGMPDAIDLRLLNSILEWEDDFLALAGRPRLW